MSAQTLNTFICNGANPPANSNINEKIVSLSYQKSNSTFTVNLQLPKYVYQLDHIPNRILDLLEIAGYIFAADRATSRGPKEAVEYLSWPRDMKFIIRVRDFEFWNNQKVKSKLSKVLLFITGDRDYSFEFQPDHNTPVESLFDKEEFAVAPDRKSAVVLFSGGLDSLAGILELLQSTDYLLYLISHSSGQPSTRRTQVNLAKALKNDFQGRIQHFSFECGLRRRHAVEETQRTRAFLFCSIAFALANRLSLNEFYTFENGITSLNLLRRQDLINAKASRTTHPKTHYLMSEFFSEFQESKVIIKNPFWQKTKTDIFKSIDKVGGRNLIGSTVSCSKTFQRLETATHCGCCFQCIDRRLAAFASGLEDIDNVGIYSKDIFIDAIESLETKTITIDYIRQAMQFATITDDEFYLERLHELIDIIEYIDLTEQDAFQAIWELCRRHGEQVKEAINIIRLKFDDPRYKINKNSLLQFVADREYLKEEPKRLSERIGWVLAKNIPIAFKTKKPDKEEILNDQIDALLRAHNEDFKREFPTTKFALSKVIPDHEAVNTDLLVEAKYIRKSTSPSKVSEGVAADLSKYPKEKFILFIIYDPERQISDDEVFKNDIEDKRRCSVVIIR